MEVVVITIHLILNLLCPFYSQEIEAQGHGHLLDSLGSGLGYRCLCWSHYTGATKEDNLSNSNLRPWYVHGKISADPAECRGKCVHFHRAAFQVNAK